MDGIMDFKVRFMRSADYFSLRVIKEAGEAKDVTDKAMMSV